MYHPKKRNSIVVMTRIVLIIVKNLVILITIIQYLMTIMVTNPQIMMTIQVNNTTSNDDSEYKLSNTDNDDEGEDDDDDDDGDDGDVDYKNNVNGNSMKSSIVAATSVPSYNQVVDISSDTLSEEGVCVSSDKLSEEKEADGTEISEYNNSGY